MTAAALTVPDTAAIVRRYLHEPGAELNGIGRLVRNLWLEGADIDTRRRYWYDPEFHAQAFEAAYTTAALLLAGAAAHLPPTGEPATP